MAGREERAIVMDHESFANICHAHRSGQSRAMSFAEAVTNVVAGYGVALLTQLLLFPTFGLYLAMTENVLIAGVFTIVSLMRSFLLRRLFERVRRSA